MGIPVRNCMLCSATVPLCNSLRRTLLQEVGVDSISTVGVGIVSRNSDIINLQLKHSTIK